SKLPTGRLAAAGAEGQLPKEPLAAADDVESYRAKLGDRVRTDQAELDVFFAGGVPAVALHEDVAGDDALRGGGATWFHGDDSHAALERQSAIGKRGFGDRRQRQTERIPGRLLEAGKLRS